MLYINVEVNGFKVKAFVDSGAQATIMSPACAEQCGIMRLVDKRYAGVAHGVGTANILGRVHSAQIKVGSLFLACSFTIMEANVGKTGISSGPEMLLGLDMLKRHQACVDLQRNVLRIQESEVPFLGEADLPESARDPVEGPTVEGPSGSRISGATGAIVQPPSTAFSGTGHKLGDSSTSVVGTQLSQQQNSTNQTANAGQSPSNITADKIAQLEAMGFSKDECIQALEATDGDIETAAGLLL